MEDFEAGHHSEPDTQKRAVLDKQRLNDVPYVSAVLSQERLLCTLISLSARCGVHHYVR